MDLKNDVNYRNIGVGCWVVVVIPCRVIMILIKFSKFQIKDILDASLQGSEKNSMNIDDAGMCDMACQTR